MIRPFAEIGWPGRPMRHASPWHGAGRGDWRPMRHPLLRPPVPRRCRRPRRPVFESRRSVGRRGARRVLRSAEAAERARRSGKCWPATFPMNAVFCLIRSCVLACRETAASRLSAWVFLTIHLFEAPRPPHAGVSDLISALRLAISGRATAIREISLPGPCALDGLTPRHIRCADHSRTRQLQCTGLTWRSHPAFLLTGTVLRNRCRRICPDTADEGALRRAKRPRRKTAIFGPFCKTVRRTRRKSL